MVKNNQIHSDSVVQDSILENNIKIYKGAQIKGSELKNKSSIGNDTFIEESYIEECTAINRRNYILKSIVGRYTYTGIGTMILSSEVGKFCSISWNVSIGGANHEHTNISTLPEWRFELMDKGIYRNSDKYNDLSCIVGNDVLISTNVIILRGVKIGHGAVIGAGAVVTKDVEPYSIVAGVPAKKIKMRFSENIVKELLKIEWWNWPIEVIRENQELLFSTEIDDKVVEKMKEVSLKIK